MVRGGSSGEEYQREFEAAEVEPLAKGSAEGMLYGGCLSLLCASLGTPYEIHTRGTIFFLEDLAEPPLPHRPHVDAVEAGRQVERREGNDLRRDAASATSAGQKTTRFKRS